MTGRDWEDVGRLFIRVGNILIVLGAVTVGIGLVLLTCDAMAEPYCFEKTNGGKVYRVCSGGEPLHVTGDGPGGVNRWAGLIGHRGPDYFVRGFPPARHWHPLGGDHRDFVWGDDPWQTSER